MTNSTRRNLQWLVLALSILLTASSLVNVIRGEGEFFAWIGLICWPILAVASVYNLRTGGKDGQFLKE
jgi:hypothetical protein